ncbi:MAG TPA: DUF4296 domain-containing protein [Bacteroidales bacterium]|nr:DUF4296 domain-containing protein [Bacteroidales bacterium]
MFTFVLSILIIMINKKYLFFIVLFLLVACQQHKQKVKLIPREKFIQVLTDIHLADGVAYSGNFLSEYHRIDSLNYSQDVFKKNGVTKAQYDTTLAYYTAHADKFNKIYDEVIANLTRMEGDLEKEKMKQQDSVQGKNMWVGKSEYKLPEDGARNKINFGIPVKDSGKYTISADIIMYRDDESENPQITAYFWYNDSTANGHRIYFPPVPIAKNGKLTTYKTSMVLTDPKVIFLRGSLLDHDPKKGEWKKHAEVVNIRVRYVPFKNVHKLK